MFFVVIATLSLRFNLAEIPNFDVMGVVVFSTGAGAGSAPNSFKQSKRTKIFVYVYSEKICLFSRIEFQQKLCMYAIRRMCLNYLALILWHSLLSFFCIIKAHKWHI